MNHWKIATICLVAVGFVLVVSGIIHRCTTHAPNYEDEIEQIEDALDSQGREQLEREKDRQERIIEENETEQELRDEVERHLDQVSMYIPEKRCQLVCK